jgi:hypothetical protein
VALAIASLVLLVGGTLHATADPAARRSAAGAARPVSFPARSATQLAGIAFGYLPGGLGRAATFAYRFAGVRFHSRVWESARPGGGTRTDLHLTVMRSSRSWTATTLRNWYVRYTQRSPPPRYVPVRVNGHRGWLWRDEVVMLWAPSVAVAARIDRSRFPTWSLIRLVRAASPIRS